MALPQFPTNLKGDAGFARTGGKSKKIALLAGENRFNHLVNGDGLIVPGWFLGIEVVWFQEALDIIIIGQSQLATETTPKLVRCRKVFYFAFRSCGIVEFDNTFTIGRVYELEAEGFGIILCLLESIPW